MADLVGLVSGKRLTWLVESRGPLTDPGVSANAPRILPAGNEAWGLLTGTSNPAEPGDYKVRLRCVEAGTLIALLVIFWIGRKAARLF